MNYFKSLFLLFIALISCNTPKSEVDTFTIAFGSCNNQVLENHLWNEIAKNNPSVWIWGGDIIYSDTYDMAYLAENYQKQKSNIAYANFCKKVAILATWDDHDFGLNDGGTEYDQKDASQQLFLDFCDVKKEDERRSQKGIYSSKDYSIGKNAIKIILLDTRYFRTSLTRDTITSKRYQPNNYGDGTMLGETQWKWLENELKNSKANFNVIMSSIQFLSSEHGFETWGNMPMKLIN